MVKKEVKNKPLILELENNSNIIFMKSQKNNDIIFKILTENNKDVLNGPLSKISTAFKFSKKNQKPEIKYSTFTDFEVQTTIDLALKHIKNMKKEKSINSYIQRQTSKNTIKFNDINRLCLNIISYKNNQNKEIIKQVENLKINLNDLEKIENEHRDFIIDQTNTILKEIEKYISLKNASFIFENLKQNNINIIDYLKDINDLIEQTNQKHILQDLNSSLEDTKIKTHIFDELTV